MSVYPENLRYTADHEWIDDSDPARIGITAYAAEQLGDIVYVELPEVGAEVKSGQYLGEIESVKSVSEIVSPVTGTVVAINPVIADEPGIVNREPYEGGWLVQVDVETEGDLLDSEEYKKQLD